MAATFQKYLESGSFAIAAAIGVAKVMTIDNVAKSHGRKVSTNVPQPPTHTSVNVTNPGPHRVNYLNKVDPAHTASSNIDIKRPQTVKKD